MANNKTAKKTTKKPQTTKVVSSKNSTIEITLTENKPKRKKLKAEKIKVISGFERYKMIEVAAYYLAEQNNFQGHAAEYWKEAEKMIDSKVTTKDEATQSVKIKQDNLQIIEGVGPKIEGLLYAEKIYTFADLAKADIGTLSAILTNAGSRYAMHKPDTWPTQAALARDGKMDELLALQDELDGGRA